VHSPIGCIRNDSFHLGEKLSAATVAHLFSLFSGLLKVMDGSAEICSDLDGQAIAILSTHGS
jgi:hypothetical protein